MKIAICDDEQFFLKKLSNKIHELAPDSEITTFTSGVALIDSNEPWDIVFLDIEMKEMNGFQTAEILKLKWPECILSFVTGHCHLAVDGYDYQPFRFILKDALESVVNRKLQETIWEYTNRNAILKTSYKGMRKTILIHKILWIESTGHCLQIKADDKLFSWHKPLEQIEPELKKYGIIRCHRSFMVSLPKVTHLDAKKATLYNDEVVPVGRTYRKYVSEQYINFHDKYSVNPN